MKGTFSIHHPTCPAFACAGQLEKIMYRDSADERWGIHFIKGFQLYRNFPRTSQKQGAAHNLHPPLTIPVS
jgi:hypothetical protein